MELEPHQRNLHLGRGSSIGTGGPPSLRLELNRFGWRDLAELPVQNPDQPKRIPTMARTIPANEAGSNFADMIT
jgi:hypothetical protein